MSGTEVHTEADELASAMAGYNKTRGDEPPVEPVAEPSTEQEDQAQAEVPPVIEEQPPVSVYDLADELKALKAKVTSTAGNPEAIRKMHGEIGNINRTLKQLQTPTAPDSDELSAALKDAEAVAVEYPELAGPLVKALKVSIAAQASAPKTDATDVDSLVESRLKHRDQENLEEDHPGYQETYKSAEFQTWLAAQPTAYQEKLKTTWNPVVASKGLTEFKNFQKAQERKQNRLAAAVTPTGMQQRAQPSTLPDEAGFNAGYSKHRRR